MDAAAGWPELTVLRNLIQTAQLTQEVRHTSLWYLGQLPQLYWQFCQTYESRFGDTIIRLSQAVFQRLSEKGSGQDGGQVAAALVTSLGNLHERLGLAPLGWKTKQPSSGGGRNKASRKVLP